MSQSNKKLLVSGCGFSYSHQQRKTWANILRSVGADITDVGGPAVSNQWIINKAFVELSTNAYDCAIIQLTSPGKLDVEVDTVRELTLVKSDSLRNFTFQGVWPSSHSREHPAKAMYEDLLYSPGLEAEDLFCKIMLLSSWCQSHHVKLIVLQAYPINWTVEQHRQLKDKILNLDEPLYKQYQQSSYYQYHDSSDSNAVPCVQYHIDLALTVSQTIGLDLDERIGKIQNHYSPT